MPGVESFLKTILRSGLLNRQQLEETLRRLPVLDRADPEVLANSLVRAGRLSRFQATKLLEGKSLGLVLGPYQILAPVGRGGMGTVYLARDNRRHLLVALKVLPPKRAREEERMLVRFLREMALCQRVSHPHLAQTFEVGEYEGVYYIAMEYIPGLSLYRLVNDRGTLATPRAARLFAEAAAALEHAHQRGVIHRDLKPSNIMVTPNDHAKLLDLGLAIIQGEIPSDHTIVGGQGYVVGTMDYLAPEQAEDASKADPRSDIYGLGCTLYFALTGRPPFPGGKAVQKIARHRSEEPMPLAELNPTVPAKFIDLVRTMMAKRPEQRFESAARVRQELLAWVTGDPALPPDTVGESDYQQAVAELEAKISADQFAEVIPESPSSQSKLRPERPLPRTLFQLDRPEASPPWPLFLLLLGVMAFAVGLGMVWLILHLASP